MKTTLMSTPITFQVVRDGATVLKSPSLKNAYYLPAVTVAEVYNPRRISPLTASRRLDLRGDAVYRVHFGLVLTQEHFQQLLSAPHQIEQSLVTLCGLRLLNLNLSEKSELTALISPMGTVVVEAGAPMLELWLDDMPTLVHTGLSQTDSVAETPGQTTIEPASKAAPGVGKAVAQEGLDEKFKKWLDDDKDAPKQTAGPATPTNFPSIAALPARVTAATGTLPTPIG